MSMTDAELKRAVQLGKARVQFPETTPAPVKFLGYSNEPAALVQFESGDERLVPLKHIRPAEPVPALTEHEILAVRALLSEPQGASADA